MSKSEMGYETYEANKDRDTVEAVRDHDPRPKMTNRRCDYCGVFEGLPHSSRCEYSKPELHKQQNNRIAGMADNGALIFDKRPLHIVTPIPPEVEQYAPEIGRFVEAMVYKLGVHSKKGKWEGQSIESRIPKLEGEVAELREAIQRGNMVEILLEAADVANYALIITAKALEK